jgi:hypothetical protein
MGSVYNYDRRNKECMKNSSRKTSCKRITERCRTVLVDNIYMDPMQTSFEDGSRMNCSEITSNGWLWC